MKEVFIYPQFDEDVHCIGSAILWRKTFCQHVKRPALDVSGTEEPVPCVSFTSPAKKRNPKKWAKAII